VGKKKKGCICCDKKSPAKGRISWKTEKGLIKGGGVAERAVRGSSKTTKRSTGVEKDSTRNQRGNLLKRKILAKKAMVL